MKCPWLCSFLPLLAAYGLAQAETAPWTFVINNQPQQEVEIDDQAMTISQDTLRALGISSIIVKRWFATIEGLKTMLRTQGHRTAQTHRVSQGDLRENRSRRPSFVSPSGCSNKFIKAWYWSPETINRR